MRTLRQITITDEEFAQIAGALVESNVKDIEPDLMREAFARVLCVFSGQLRAAIFGQVAKYIE